jgi:transposase-like protein
MSKRYSQEEKDRALERLAANTGDASLTSAQTGIPLRTLHAWRRALEQHGAQQQQQPVKLAPSDDEALRLLRQQLVSEALSFIASLDEVVEEASLNQRVSALGQLIDRIVKLAVLLPPAQSEQVIRIEYADPDTMEDTVP